MRRIGRYIHLLKEWPTFTWEDEKIILPLSTVRHKQGRLLGKLEGLGFRLREEATLETLTQDVIKSSEIEGEKKDKSVKAFLEGISGIKRMANNADKTLDTMVKAEENWFFGGILKLFK